MEMPKLEPIPIRTKGKSFLTRVWALLTVVRKWRVVEDWVYRLPDGTLIVIPAGFIFDGASMPKPLWGILSPVGLLLIQGLVHDFGYRYDYLWAVDRFGNFYRYKENAGQKYWDSLFKGVGLDVNDMIVVDQIAWAMLRLFGCLAWRNNRKLKLPEIMPTTYPLSR